MELTPIKEASSHPIASGETIENLVKSLVHFDASCIVAFSETSAPRLAYSSLGSRANESAIAFYQEHANYLDPLYVLFARGHQSAFLVDDKLKGSSLFDAAAFQVGLYHPLISMEPGPISGYVAFLLRAGRIGVGLSLFRLEPSAPFSKDDYTKLEEIEAAILPLLSRFLGAVKESSSNMEPAGLPTIEQLVTEDLSPRQHEVVCLYLKGSSLKEIGRELGISPNTARVHLQSAYRRLAVRSRGDIFALILRRLGLFVGHGAVSSTNDEELLT